MFERPQFVVLGKRKYDQGWIDSTVEGGVGACGWRRPAKRPAALDAPVVQAKATLGVQRPVKKKGIIRRTVERVLPRERPGSADPIAPVETFDSVTKPPIVVVPGPLPAPPLKKRDAVDELLSPADPVPKPVAPRRSSKCRLGIWCN